jgi:hypothetical protein
LTIFFLGVRLWTARIVLPWGLVSAGTAFLWERVSDHTPAWIELTESIPTSRTN